MESTARKLRSMCEAELKHAAKEGRFDANGPPSRLWTIVNAMSRLLRADTQLVESINSLIRLIGQRSPSIDLDTMSARITMKKALTRELDAASAKRWSAVAAHARPLMQELIAAGPAYKQVQDEAGRFEQPAPVSVQQLEPELSNTNLALALPDMQSSPKRVWASKQAVKVKQCLDKIKSSCRNIIHLAALSACSLIVFMLKNADEDTPSDRYFLQCFSHRSLIVALRLSRNTDGTFQLQDNRFCFISSLDLLLDLHASCFATEGRSKYIIYGRQAVHLGAGRVACVDTSPDSQELSISLTDMSASEPALRIEKPPTPRRQNQQQAAIADEMDDDNDDAQGDLEDLCVESGYAFTDDVQDSGESAFQLDEELGTQQVTTAHVQQIKSAVKNAASRRQSKASGGRGQQAATSTPFYNDIGLVAETAAVIRETHAGREAAALSLTDVELEQEALLMIIRDRLSNPGEAAGTGASGSDVQAAASRRATKVDEYKCFEDDGRFLASLLAMSDEEDEQEASNASAAPAAVAAGVSDRLPAILPAWEHAICLSLKSIQDRYRRCNLGAGYNNEVSLLVSLPPAARTMQVQMQASQDASSVQNAEPSSGFEVVCVIWTDARQRHARTTRIDTQQRVVYSPSHVFGKPQKSLCFPVHEFYDLLHASGAQSRKFKGALRDPLPNDVTRFLMIARLVCSYANNVTWPPGRHLLGSVFPSLDCKCE